MSELAKDRASVQARRAEYYRLRDEGLNMWDAGHQVGIENETARRYERWWRAERNVPASAPDLRSAGQWARGGVR